MPEGNLIVERDGSWIVFLIMAVLMGFITLILLWSMYVSVTSDKKALESFIIPFIGCIVSLPLTIYYFSFSFAKKKIFEINELGILTSKGQLIKWDNIFEIETTDYPGPRMRFYKIKIFVDNYRKQKTKIFFSSDINEEWSTIVDFLTSYSVKYGIKIT